MESKVGSPEVAGEAKEARGKQRQCLLSTSMALKILLRIDTNLANHTRCYCVSGVNAPIIVVMQK